MTWVPETKIFRILPLPESLSFAKKSPRDSGDGSILDSDDSDWSWGSSRLSPENKGVLQHPTLIIDIDL